jgi:hypothetical protein
VWCGYPGHFIGGASCLFHLSTRVGNHRISTVGDYRPRGAGELGEMQQIGGSNLAFFETYVFTVDPSKGEPCCGEVTDWGEIDGERWATPEEAWSGHMEYCRKWAAR